MDSPFLGLIQLFAFGFAPMGWKLCDGSSLSVAQNSALYSLLGNRFGGDTVNFNLPNIQPATPLKASNKMIYYICTEGIYPSRP
jgi:microcystin-dependent protein